jgi:hypothetical protein
MSSSGERLGRYVKDRRLRLDRNQMEVWQAGGPSNTTLSDIENGRLKTLTRVTARKLDAGLNWGAGSARAVWDGGEPVELDSEDQSESEELALADLRDAVAELRGELAAARERIRRLEDGA